MVREVCRLCCRCDRHWQQRPSRNRIPKGLQYRYRFALARKGWIWAWFGNNLCQSLYPLDRNRFACPAHCGSKTAAGQAAGHSRPSLSAGCVIEFADFTGDSFELSRQAAEQKKAEFVVFCGVHFMAESADILTAETVKVILPDLGAGCSMADMANLDQTLECWEQLRDLCPDQTIVPVTYMNSSAAIKAFVGEHGGAVCTSSNCRNVLHGPCGRGQTHQTGAEAGK